MRNALAILLVLALWDCTRRELPRLPAVETKPFEPAVKRSVEAAFKAAQNKPEDAASVGRLGMVLQAHSQFQAAAQCYRRAIGIDPEKPEWAYYLGVSLAADGKHEEALPYLTRAADSMRQPAAYLRLADTLYATGRKPEARERYRKVVELSPGNAAGHYGLGRTSEGATAEKELTEALRLFPRYGAAQFALANLTKRPELLAQYERDKTTAPPMEDPALDAVLALNVGTTGLTRQAQALERAGRLEEALAMERRILEAKPEDQQAWVNVQSLAGRLGRAAEVEEAFTRITQLNPNRADAYYNYGVFCLGQSRLAEARRMFEKTVALDRGAAEAWFNLGALAEGSGDLAAGRAAFAKAAAARPDYSAAHFRLGRIAANQRRYEEAIEHFRVSVATPSPEQPIYCYALGATYARAGRRAEAGEWLGRARTAALSAGQGALVASIEKDMKTLGIAP